MAFGVNQDCDLHGHAQHPSQQLPPVLVDSGQVSPEQAQSSLRSTLAFV